MATITAPKMATLSPPATVKGVTRISSTPVLGLPVIARRGCQVRYSIEEKGESKCKVQVNTPMVKSLMIAAAAAMTTTTGSAIALVDERMSTEGTGLPFGLSNNLLGWILFGIFGLIWSLYIIYALTLDEDDDSALSL